MSIGQWGNHEYLQTMFRKKDWPDYTKLSKPGYNDLDYPISTWVFAIKD